MEKFDLLVHRWIQFKKSRYGRHRKGWKKERLQKWNQIRNMAKKLKIKIG